MASQEAENREVVSRYMDVTNRGDLAVLDELVIEEYVEHDPMPGQGAGREGLKGAHVAIRSAFPDGHFDVEQLLAQGDLVFARGLVRGTHGGTFMGVAPTGKAVQFSTSRLFRLAGGRLTEGWTNADMMGLLQQLGAIPSPGGAPPPEGPVAPTADAASTASTAESEAVMRRMIGELWNDGDLAVADELFHPQSTSPSAPRLPPGPEGVKMIVSMFRSAFPDYWISIEELVADDGLVAARLRQGGTQSGELMGIPPSGKRAEWTEMGLLRVAGGQVLESWYDVDMLSLMSQLGVGSSPAG